MKIIIAISLLFAQTKAPMETQPAPVEAEVKPEPTPEKLKRSAALIGIGYGVETGVLGTQYRLNFSNNVYAQLSGLVDFLGFGWGYGLGFRTDAKENECFWLFGCKQRYRFSLGMMNYGGADRDLSEGGEIECENGFCVSFGGSEGAKYKVSSSSAMVGSMAWQYQVSTFFFYEFQVGYWTMVDKPTFRYRSGPQTANDLKSLEDSTEAHVALGLNVGFLF